MEIIKLIPTGEDYLRGGLGFVKNTAKNLI